MMKKISMLMIALLSLSFLPFIAEAGHWKVKCYRPCYKCKKVCYRKWVRDWGDYRRYHRHHHHHYHW